MSSPLHLIEGGSKKIKLLQDYQKLYLKTAKEVRIHVKFECKVDLEYRIN